MRGVLEIDDTLRSARVPAARYGQNGGESAGFSVFRVCSVDLQREGFVFVQTHQQIQDERVFE